MTPDAYRANALAAHHSRDHIRLRTPDGEYLHLSGNGTTRDIDHAWLGSRAQARTLRERAKVRGEAWPFKGVRRRADTLPTIPPIELRLLEFDQ